MDAIRTLLESQLLFTLFLTVALGYLVGEISIRGFSLGSGAVLFVGLAIGGFAPKSAPPGARGNAGPAAVPVRRGHPVRRAVLQGADERRRTQGECRRGAGRHRCRFRVPGAASPVRRQARRSAGALRGCRHEHGNAAGDHRHLEKRRRSGRLRRRLSVRGRHSHPLHPSAQYLAQAEVRYRPLKTLETAEIALRNPDFIGHPLFGTALTVARGCRDRCHSPRRITTRSPQTRWSSRPTTCCWRPPRPRRRSRPQ